MTGRSTLLLMVALVLVAGGVARAQDHQHSATDARQLVKFPDAMREHTLSNMRDHLLALQEIDVALSKSDYDRAASVAETRLGMSSLEAHGAAHLAPFMPKGMQDIGTGMHRAASKFAVEAQNAAASNDVRPALASLGAIMQQCVACHAAYRLH
jgi:cytochrome c556